jgi:hypothetical protein
MTRTLDQFKAETQKRANALGKALVILNLNPYSALYVMREYSARFDGVMVDGVVTLPRDLVCIVRPQVEAAQ